MYARVRNGCTVAYEGFERQVSTRLRRSDSLAVPLLTRSDWVPPAVLRPSWNGGARGRTARTPRRRVVRPRRAAADRRFARDDARPRRRHRGTGHPGVRRGRRHPLRARSRDHGGGLGPAGAAGRRPPVRHRRGPVPRKPADGRGPTEPGARRRHALAEVSWTDARRRCRELSVAPVGHRQSRDRRGTEPVLPEPFVRRNR